MLESTWIEFKKEKSFCNPTAIVGSPGLRSIGGLVIDHLVDTLKAELIAELYSTHFPIIYQTIPSYVSHPHLPGIGGVKIESGILDLPKIRFYSTSIPSLVITKGYHANFDGQYEVAEKVMDFFKELKIERIIVVAGYGMEGEEVCCAATNKEIINDMRMDYELKVGYEGPFYGFSGIVFGLAKIAGIDALCLFAKTKPIPEKPDLPDEKASKILLRKLLELLNVPPSLFDQSEPQFNVK
jgi:proteasome assembly chaperone (PAC2) family protein